MIKHRNDISFENSASGEYTDLESDSERIARNYDSVPNTCSYEESDMVTPQLSVRSGGQFSHQANMFPFSYSQVAANQVVRKTSFND